MSRTLLPPLSGLASAIPADFTEIAPEVELRLAHGVVELLLGQHCCEVGTAKGQVRDEAWGRDIRQLIERATPHMVYTVGASGLVEAHREAVKLDTIRVEVDDNAELCCWIYEEG